MADEKKRYALGPFEEPDSMNALTDLDIAPQVLADWLKDGEVGDVITFKIVELTDAEVEALPEL